MTERRARAAGQAGAQARDRAATSGQVGQLEGDRGARTQGNQRTADRGSWESSGGTRSGAGSYGGGGGARAGEEEAAALGQAVAVVDAGAESAQPEPSDSSICRRFRNLVAPAHWLVSAGSLAIKQDAGADNIDCTTLTLSDAMAAAVKHSLNEWRAHGNVTRLWGRDASLWTGSDEAQWLGWLDVVNDQLAHVDRLIQLTETSRISGFSHVLLLGMGGSSLCPEVMTMTFGKTAGFPELHVLDSTDPAQVKAFESKIDLKKTLFIVSSKSGSTLEPNILKQYFFSRVEELLGRPEAGHRFIAITDPGSKMQRTAEDDGFRDVFFGRPTIGGRYSALSNFGLVPAAMMGVDVVKLLKHADEMVSSCMPAVPVEENPGVVLGAILGVAAKEFGRDKVTIVTSPGIHDLGAWLEQLLAESTGKGGKGLIPIDREILGKPDVYDSDRLFVYLRLSAAPDASQDASVEALEGAGHPVVRIALDDLYDLGREFFRWEIATAVAGSILGINPFDQPDVEASKVATRKLTDEYERSGALPAETPIFAGDGIKLFADEKNAGALANAANGDKTLAGYLRAHVNRLGVG